MARNDPRRYLLPSCRDLCLDLDLCLLVDLLDDVDFVLRVLDESSS